MRGRIPKDEHPLNRAVRLKHKAINSGANLKVIARLEKRVEEEVSKSLKIFGGSTEWIDNLLNKKMKKHIKKL